MPSTSPRGRGLDERAVVALQGLPQDVHDRVKGFSARQSDGHDPIAGVVDRLVLPREGAVVREGHGPIPV